MDIDTHPDKMMALRGTVRTHLCLPYIEATVQYLQEQSEFWQNLVEQVHQAINITDERPWDDWIADQFEYHTLWQRLAEEIWVNVLAWTVQDLDASTAESIIRTLDEEPFRPEIWRSLFFPDSSEMETLLDGLITQLTETLAQRLAQEIDQEILALEIETSRLPQRQQNPTERAWAGAESPEAETVTTIRLNHVLSRSEDFKVLPWELIGQLQQQIDYSLVQLVLVLTAHTMRQSQPLLNAFTLRSTELLEQLGWPTNAIGLTKLLKALEQVDSLVLDSVWMLDSQNSGSQTVQVRGRVWEVHTDLRGDFDWPSGQILNPQLGLITIRAGLWLSQTLDSGGESARSSFESFGRLALTLLRLDFCRDSLLLRVLFSLMHSSLSSEISGFYGSVEELLEGAGVNPAGVGQTTRHTIQFFEDWNRAMGALQALGWTAPLSEWTGPVLPERWFYTQPCPSWLSPLSTETKPHDWIEQWLSQTVALTMPTHTQKRHYGSSPSSIRKLRFDRLTGIEIRSARKALRLTQAQLAQELHVHQSLVAKIESGQRSISDDLEQSLRMVLKL